MRKAAHEALNKSVVQDYTLLQCKEAAYLVAGMLREPDLWDEHIRR